MMLLIYLPFQMTAGSPSGSNPCQPVASLSSAFCAQAAGRDAFIPEEGRFRDSPASSGLFSPFSISPKDGFTAHLGGWASRSPARPFSQQVKHWFVNRGNHRGNCMKRNGLPLFVCVRTRSPLPGVHRRDQQPTWKPLSQRALIQRGMINDACVCYCL